MVHNAHFHFPSIFLLHCKAEWARFPPLDYQTFFRTFPSIYLLKTEKSPWHFLLINGGIRLSVHVMWNKVFRAHAVTTANSVLEIVLDFMFSWGFGFIVERSSAGKGSSLHGGNYGGYNPLKQLKPPSLRPAQQCEAKVVTGLRGSWMGSNKKFSFCYTWEFWCKRLYFSLFGLYKTYFQHRRGGIHTRRTQNVLEIRLAPQLCYRYHVNKRGEFVCMPFHSVTIGVSS